MKIVLIGTTASSIYGFRSDLIKLLIKLNHEVYTFTSEYKENEIEKIESLGAIPVIYSLNRGGLNPFKDIKSTFLLTQKIKKIDPDIVFSYFSKPIIFGTIAAKIAKIPKVVGMLEGLGFAFTEQPEGLSNKAKIIKAIQVALYKIALPKLDNLILLNADDNRDLLEKYSIVVKNIHILGGIGIDLKQYSYQPVSNYKENIKFLFIGRLLKEKGIYEFVSAAKIVKRRYPQAEFTILGAIDEYNPGALKRSELEQLISSGIINYHGYVNNINEWITQSHVFVLPSYREGFPRSTQEAMAIGRAILTTDVPGCRETVINGVNGFLIERWSSISLAQKMIYFIENPDEIKRMGQESYKIAKKKFDVNQVNIHLLNILGL